MRLEEKESLIGRGEVEILGRRDFRKKEEGSDEIKLYKGGCLGRAL